MDMVMRLLGGLVAAGLLAACADPFAPADPEAPSTTGTVQTATRADMVPSLWAKGLTDDNVLQTLALLDESFQGSSGGASFKRTQMELCLGTFAAGKGLDSAQFAWHTPPPGSTDSVTADVDWTLVEADGSRFGGRATWSVVRDDAAEWRIARWVEPGTSGNWRDACGGAW